MSDSSFTQHAVAVATELWGEPNKRLSTPKKIAWGSQGARTVDVEKGAWFDHTAAEGGGVLDLVMRELPADKAGALAWLTKHGYLEDREPQRSRHEAQDGRDEPPEYDSPFEPDSQPAASADEGKWVEVQTYDYTNGDGELVYQVVRKHLQLADGSFEIDLKTGNPKKRFAQRRPDGKGGWVWNLEGIGHTIYRRSEIELAIEAGKTIYLPEGEKDVQTFEAWGLVASTNSGGAKHWNPTLAQLFAGADVIIVVDNDEAGRDGGERRARSLNRIAGRVRLLDLAKHVPELPAKGDVTDWRDRLDGTAEQLSEIVGQLADWRPKPPESKWGAIGPHQLHVPHLKHDFLIDDFLDRQGVAMMPGASGSAKTFLVLEMGMCVALGRDFFGMKVKPGLVLYQAGEGKQGVAKRLDGWFIDRGIAPEAKMPFRMLTRRINLFNDDKDTDELIEEAKAWSEYFELPVRMLVVDTFNKAITGANENAGQDMTKVLSRLERISVTLDTAVVVPIHKSAEGKMRGHTSLTGDVSNVIDVTELSVRDRNQRSIRTFTLLKNKDGDKGSPLRFVLRQVVLDVGIDGKAITTCVVDRPDGDTEELARQGRLGTTEVLVLRALRDAADREGITAPAGVRGAGTRPVIEAKAWKESVRRTWLNFKASEDEPERREKELRDLMSRSSRILKVGGYVESDTISGEGGEKTYVWWTGKSTERPKPKVVEPPAPLPPDVREFVKSGEAPF